MCGLGELALLLQSWIDSMEEGLQAEKGVYDVYCDPVMSLGIWSKMCKRGE